MSDSSYVRPFVGTAQHYARYRVPYPRELIDDLLTRTSTTGEGNLLDLACGTGQLSLPLAPHFRQVWAVDLEAEMIEVGRHESEELGVTNVRWLVGRAEDLALDRESFELVAIGSAFHRLDYRLVAERVLGWLVPGGHLAVANSSSIWSGTAKWQPLVIDVLRRWSPKRPAPLKPAEKSVSYVEVLRTAGYQHVERHEFDIPHKWTLDELIGYLHSTSIASLSALGDSVEEFEAEVRQTLLSYDPSGHYSETMRFDYTLGRRENHRR